MALAFADLAAGMVDELTSGRPARISLGSKDTAFSWLPGLPVSIASYVSTAKVAGMSADVVVIEPSLTPVAKVTAGSQKPHATKFTPKAIQLAKYAGMAEFTLETHLSTDALLSVLGQVLGGQALQALEADAVAALGAAAGSATGADLQAAVVAGQAKVLSIGARPGLVVLGPAGYSSLVTGGAAGFHTDPTAGPIGTWLGSIVHVSPSVPAGTAYVLDPSAVFIAENEVSPLALLDPYSGSDTNTLRVVVDVIAAPVVIHPGAVVACTVA